MQKQVKLVNELMLLQNKKIAEHSQRFFKTGIGEYGEGDLFLGIRVPVLRKISKKYKSIEFPAIQYLIESKFHEVRLLALFILVIKFKRAKTTGKQKEIFDFYLQNCNYVNNWDLVDSSAHYILGPWLLNRDRQLLFQMAVSKNLWQRRIAIMTTFHFIKNEDYSDTLKLAEVLLHDSEGLIHKAVGWMLREVGNKDKPTLELFLVKHYKKMPRTMLRYAIEKISKEERKEYLEGRK